ncbi:hypothetical protein ABDK56_06375 [Sphingomonas sp. ASV193]|uniref:hypothetical protein n=1 Tax=Sphingomonas sp. ASV193 TaxID=3144405 RepID=UPI0032E8B110
MDLNYLHQRLAVSLVQAERATCEASQLAHGELARRYAAQIAEARRVVCCEEGAR